jgi:hypothetical protein
MAITTISERLLTLIDQKLNSSKRFKNLEDLTGVGSRKWNSFALGEQKATVEMIEAASKVWPQHAFWLATGIEDSSTGHTDPNMRESNHYEIEDVAEEIFKWKLSRKYEPEKLFGLMRKSVDAKDWKNYKSFADLFDDNGYISKLDISMRLLAWLTKEEESRPEYELEILRMLFMENAPVNTRVEEVFFDWKKGQDSPKLKLHEPYLSQVLRLKKATSIDKNIDAAVIKKTKK